MQSESPLRAGVGRIGIPAVAFLAALQAHTSASFVHDLIGAPLGLSREDGCAGSLVRG